MTASNTQSPGDFVRAAEWRRIHEFATSTAVLTAPAALVVEAEAGAGKSTLWRAGVAAATAAGSRVLRSEPSATETELSYAALSDLLADALPDFAANIPALQRQALEVALLLAPAAAEPPTARSVGMAVLAVLRSCLEAGPLLIGIDDAQWLDAASLDALAFALRRITGGPLALLVAARTYAPADPLTAGTPPPSHDWRDLVAALPVAAVPLPPLDTRQIRELLPGVATAAQARRVAEQSRGNPFWAREIAANLATSEGSVPPLASHALTERLARSLSQTAAEALTTVAAAGRISVRGALAVLDHLLDPAAALDAAVSAGVVVENDGRVAPAHPLIGAVVLESAPPAGRAQLYRRLAAAHPEPERHAYFAALAAGPEPDPATAEALDAAAEAAHARAANAAAGQFAAQAVTFTPAADEAALVRRRIRAGELLFLAGDVAGSLRHLEHLDIDRLPVADLELALPMLIDIMDVAQGPSAAAAFLAGIVESTGPDVRRRALIMALASEDRYGLAGGQRAAALEAIRCAEAAGEVADPALHRALINLMLVKVTGGEGLDTSLLDRAERLEARLPVHMLLDTADFHRAVWSRNVEDLDTARASLNRFIVRAREADQDWALAMSLSYLAATAELAGDYAAAEAALTEVDQVATDHDWPQTGWYYEPYCERLIAAGKLDQALGIADERLPEREEQPIGERFVGAWIRAKVSLWRGDAEAAIRWLELASWCEDERRRKDPGARYLLDAPLAEAYAAVGRTDEAARIAAWLGDVGRRLGRPALTGMAARIDALLAAAGGDLDAAAQSARAAVAAHERSPLRPELVRSLLALGRIERRRRARRESLAVLRRAHELATEMAHRPLLAQIEEELARVSPPRARTELTDAERRVAGQIMAGATNREAAAALFISVRTVETHLAAIYRKLGVRHRSELQRVLSSQQPD